MSSKSLCPVLFGCCRVNARMDYFPKTTHLRLYLPILADFFLILNPDTVVVPTTDLVNRVSRWEQLTCEQGQSLGTNDTSCSLLLHVFLDSCSEFLEFQLL